MWFENRVLLQASITSGEDDVPRLNFPLIFVELQVSNILCFLVILDARVICKRQFATFCI